MKLSRIAIWTLTLAVFVLAGYLVYKNYKAEPLPAAVSFFDVNSYSDTKAIFCPVSFNTFEIIADTSRSEYKPGNFPTYEDIDVRFDGYTSPIRHEVKWRGKKRPTPAQLARMVSPYLTGYQVFRVENIEYDIKRCYYGPIDPDQPVDK